MVLLVVVNLAVALVVTNDGVGGDGICIGVGGDSGGELGWHLICVGDRVDLGGGRIGINSVYDQLFRLL